MNAYNIYRTLIVTNRNLSKIFFMCPDTLFNNMNFRIIYLNLYLCPRLDKNGDLIN